MIPIEQRLHDAFADARRTVGVNPDLFERVTRSLEDARARRRFRVRLLAGAAVFVAVNAGLVLALSWLDRRVGHLSANSTDTGRFAVPWWVIELVTNIVLVALVVALGPFIKRFGRSYAADVFRANPRTGKSYLVLTDVAYYLVFTAFILLTMTLSEPYRWASDTAAQLEHEVARVGGMMLLVGVLHGLNVVALPVIGRLLAGARPDDSQGGRDR